MRKVYIVWMLVLLPAFSIGARGDDSNGKIEVVMKAAVEGRPPLMTLELTNSSVKPIELAGGGTGPDRFGGGMYRVSLKKEGEPAPLKAGLTTLGSADFAKTVPVAVAAGATVEVSAILLRAGGGALDARMLSAGDYEITVDCPGWKLEGVPLKFKVVRDAKEQAAYDRDLINACLAGSDFGDMRLRAAPISEEVDALIGKLDGGGAPGAQDRAAVALAGIRPAPRRFVDFMARQLENMATQGARDAAAAAERVARFTNVDQSDEMLDADLSLARSKADEGIRSRAVYQLRLFKQPGAAKALAGFLGDPGEGVRLAAASNLAFGSGGKDQGALRVLLAGAGSSDVGNRGLAVRALGMYTDSPEAKKVVEGAAHDPNPLIRDAANAALLFGQSAVPSAGASGGK